jgi:putative transposase
VSRARCPKERSGITKSRFTDEKINGFLKQVEVNAGVKKPGRKHGFRDASFYKCRSGFGGMDVADVRQPRELEGKNGKLKKLLAETRLDVAARKVVARGTGKPAGASHGNLTPAAVPQEVSGHDPGAPDVSFR